jgi:hypothetical protein
MCSNDRASSRLENHRTLNSRPGRFRVDQLRSGPVEELIESQQFQSAGAGDMTTTDVYAFGVLA